VSEATKRRRTARNVGLIRNYLSQRAWVDYGETDPVVLDCDHVRGDKMGTISRIVRDLCYT
jgi:hypothetical protein